MSRLFTNGKCLVALAALLGLPGATADPSDALAVPLLDGDEPPLLGDGSPPLPDYVEIAPLPDETWKSVLVGRLVNLTWDYARNVDSGDNATEAQRKATQYLDAVRVGVKSVQLPNPLDYVCVDFVPNEELDPDRGFEPGPGRWRPEDYVSLPIVPGRWSAEVMSGDKDCLVP